MLETTVDMKTRLLDAAQDLIQRRGLNAMSFQDLSDAVGIRKASVHHHFASKAEMVNALLERYQSDFRAAVDAILRSRASGKTKLKRYFQLFLDTLEAGHQDKSCLCGVLLAELSSLDEEAVSRVQRFLRGNAGSIREMIAAGVEDGSLPERLKASGAAEMVLAALEGGLLLARCDGGPRRLEKTLTRLMDLMTLA